MSKVYSLKDVAEHSSKESPWFIIKGKVYDITKLLDLHPGGDQVLLQVAGKDATEAFYGRGHSEKAQKWMKDFEIGSLGDQVKKWWQCPLWYGVGAAVLIGVASVVIVSVIKSSKH
jgi:cytochrome b involved in lipid metabolism